MESSAKQQARTSKLAPVLEDYYMGPEAAPIKQRNTKPAACKKPVGWKKKGSSMSPLVRLLGNLRDAYVRMMNDLAERPDMNSLAGVAAAPYKYYSPPVCCHGAATTTECYNDSCELLRELLFRPERRTTQTELTKPWDLPSLQQLVEYVQQGGAYQQAQHGTASCSWCIIVLQVQGFIS